MYFRLFIHILWTFPGILYTSRKANIWPSFFTTKNPQAVDNLWINWARYVYLSSLAFISSYMLYVTLVEIGVASCISLLVYLLHCLVL